MATCGNEICKQKINAFGLFWGLMSLVIDLQQLSVLQALWERKRGSREFPSRLDFDVFKLGPLMGNLTVLEVLDNGMDCHFRLHGTNIVNHYGYEMTGKLASSLPHVVAKLFLRSSARSFVSGRRCSSNEGMSRLTATTQRS
tara:strand:+ start:1483 stop:1908 length:426 start_codon:yes stop_codon:yes gene_type:complete